jgi:SAM-dependent methyltransferase
MREPFKSQFRDLIKKGAGVQDVHGTTVEVGYAVTYERVSEAFLERELGRVELHSRGLVPLLENFAGRVDAVLDAGCSTGGGTVALALSPLLGAREVVGVDPNPLSIEAARVRARGYDLPADRVRFEVTTAGQRLPFPDDSFQLTVCVSVLEFISSHAERAAFAAELRRVTSPAGLIYLATPNPLRLREYHTGRLLGNLRHREGYPWESPPWAIRRMFPGCRQIPVVEYQVRHVLRRRRLPGASILAPLGPVLATGLTWMRFLFRKPSGAAASASS